MTPMLATAVLAVTVGSGLLAGFLFAFSNTVMPGLARIDPPAGIAAMQGINVVVQNPVFFAAFFGTPLLAAILGVRAVLQIGEPGSVATILGALLVVAGVFGVTVVMNVPMNEALAGLDPTEAASSDYWRIYLTDWTMWNHVRTVACVFATAAFAHAYRVAA